MFLSKVGDTSIDLPEASCLIQISSHYGSRRQEAQRLGRILRPKKKAAATADAPNAYFYTLVSKDTEEMYFSTKRQQFLVDQGYAFKVITKLSGLDGRSTTGTGTGLVYSDKGRQIDLLNTVLLASEADYTRELAESDVDDVSDGDDQGRGNTSSNGGVVRSNATLTSLSGGDSMAYLEFNKVYMGRRRRT